MLLLKFLNRLIKVLRSAASPKQIAGGFVLGMIIGLTPFWNLHNLVVFILIVILNVNISMALFAFALFSGFAYLLDPLFHNTGYWLLVGLDFLHGFWTKMYNMPIIALTNFNNTVVMGSFLISLLLAPILFPSTAKGVVLYREKIDSKVQKLKFVQAMKSSKIYSIYERISHFRD